MAFAGEPSGPDLDGKAGGIGVAAITAEIHHQIAKPPRAGAVGEAAAEEPHFVAAVHFTGGVDRVHLVGVHRQRLSGGSVS